MLRTVFKTVGAERRSGSIPPTVRASRTSLLTRTSPPSSHLYKAPISGNQEVSGFGDSGTGDTGDNWTIQCADSGEKVWQRGSPINFVHVDTSRFLTSAGNAKFTTSNCGQGCPIMGQNEVSAATKKTVGAEWLTGQGVYFPPKDAAKQKDEL